MRGRSEPQSDSRPYGEESDAGMSNGGEEPVAGFWCSAASERRSCCGAAPCASALCAADSAAATTSSGAAPLATASRAASRAARWTCIGAAGKSSGSRGGVCGAKLTSETAVAPASEGGQPGATAHAGKGSVAAGDGVRVPSRASRVCREDACSSSSCGPGGGAGGGGSGGGGSAGGCSGVVAHGRQVRMPDQQCVGGVGGFSWLDGGGGGGNDDEHDEEAPRDAERGCNAAGAKGSDGGCRANSSGVDVVEGNDLEIKRFGLTKACGEI